MIYGEKLVHNKERKLRKDGLNMTASDGRLKFVNLYTFVNLFTCKRANSPTSTSTLLHIPLFSLQITWFTTGSNGGSWKIKDLIHFADFHIQCYTVYLINFKIMKQKMGLTSQKITNTDNCGNFDEIFHLPKIRLRLCYCTLIHVYHASISVKSVACDYQAFTSLETWTWKLWVTMNLCKNTLKILTRITLQMSLKLKSKNKSLPFLPLSNQTVTPCRGRIRK